MIEVARQAPSLSHTPGPPIVIDGFRLALLKGIQLDAAAEALRRRCRRGTHPPHRPVGTPPKMRSSRAHKRQRLAARDRAFELGCRLERELGIADKYMSAHARRRFYAERLTRAVAA